MKTRPSVGILSMIDGKQIGDNRFLSPQYLLSSLGRYGIILPDTGMILSVGEAVEQDSAFIQRRMEKVLLRLGRCAMVWMPNCASLRMESIILNCWIKRAAYCLKPMDGM